MEANNVQVKKNFAQKKEIIYINFHVQFGPMTLHLDQLHQVTKLGNLIFSFEKPYSIEQA